MVEFGSLFFWITTVVLVLSVRLLPLSGAQRSWLFLAAVAALHSGSPLGGFALLCVALYGHVAMRFAQTQLLLVTHLVVLTTLLYFGIRGADVAPSFASILPVVASCRTVHHYINPPVQEASFQNHLVASPL